MCRIFFLHLIKFAVFSSFVYHCCSSAPAMMGDHMKPMGVGVSFNTLVHEHFRKRSLSNFYISVRFFGNSLHLCFNNRERYLHIAGLHYVYLEIFTTKITMDFHCSLVFIMHVWKFACQKRIMATSFLYAISTWEILMVKF